MKIKGSMDMDQNTHLDHTWNLILAAEPFVGLRLLCKLNYMAMPYKARSSTSSAFDEDKGDWAEQR